jgi:hypothetical protein
MWLNANADKAVFTPLLPDAVRQRATVPRFFPILTAIRLETGAARGLGFRLWLIGAADSFPIGLDKGCF